MKLDTIVYNAITEVCADAGENSALSALLVSHRHRLTEAVLDAIDKAASKITVRDASVENYRPLMRDEAVKIEDA